tara:strand:+ start:1158 stop:1901 length:744 start_codon:yes stop_codon:yes gene_type:complete
MDTDNSLLLHTDQGKLHVSSNTLLIFLDETGTETLNDPKAPYFGVGGLLVECRNYQKQVEVPWSSIKDKYFDGKGSPLHASDMHKVSKKRNEKFEALNTFFDSNDFGRVGVVCTNNVILEDKIKVEELIFHSMWNSINTVANKMKWKDIVVIYEENDRLIPAFRRGMELMKLENSRQEPITIRYLTMTKECVFSGLEVADFIIHTVGRQGKQFSQGSDAMNIDFKKVFSKSKNQYFFHIIKAKSKNR